MSQELYNELFNAISQESEVMVGLQLNAAHSEPMYAHVDKDRDTNLWFFMANDNRVASGGKSMIQFVSKDHKLFACMSGDLVEETDPDTLEKFWSNSTEAWFEGGIDDPKLHMMRFELQNVEIWTKTPNLTGALKLASGAKVEPEDVGDHAVVDIK